MGLEHSECDSILLLSPNLFSVESIPSRILTSAISGTTFSGWSALSRSALPCSTSCIRAMEVTIFVHDAILSSMRYKYTRGCGRRM